MPVSHRIVQIHAVIKPRSLRATQNAPPFVSKRGSDLRFILESILGSILGAIGLCAALSNAAGAASVMAHGKMPAWQQFDDAKRPYDLSPAAGSRGRRPPGLPPAARSGNDRREDSTPYCRGACLIEMAAELVPARNRMIETAVVATPPVPAYRAPPMAVPVPATPAASAMAGPPASIPPVPLVIDRPSPLAGQMWDAAAALLLCAVLFVPGAVALSFFALAGFIVGGMTLVFDLTWQYQVSIFAALGVALVMLWARRDAARRRRSGNHVFPAVGERGPDAVVGRVFQLDKPIDGGSGLLRFDGTFWRIAGKDCAVGTRVKVLRAEGTLLIVAPVEC
jgi:inner membrane protein